MGTVHEIRYAFEHRLLPMFFYENQLDFIAALLQDESVLGNMINDMFKKSEVENPYNESAYRVEPFKVTEEVMCMKIICPEPEDEPLCYCSYMFFDMKFEHVAYFCIEKGNEEGSNMPFLCSWTKEYAHSNFGNCTLENNNDYIACADIFMEREYGMTRKD